MKERFEILVSGFGGQGVVRMGQSLGSAAVKEGFRVTMLKSHGTEQRGGYVRTQLVLSKDTIDSPLVENADVICALSKAAYNKFASLVNDDGLVIYDPAFVDAIDPKIKARQLAVPAKDLAVEKLGRPIYSNSIMMGALTRAIGIINKDVMLETVLEVIPKYQDENRKAFDIGYTYVNV